MINLRDLLNVGGGRNYGRHKAGDGSHNGDGGLLSGESGKNRGPDLGYGDDLSGGDEFGNLG